MNIGRIIKYAKNVVGPLAAGFLFGMFTERKRTEKRLKRLEEKVGEPEMIEE